MLKDWIDFMHLSYHFFQTISQKWNLMKYPKKCFHRQQIFVGNGATKIKQF